MQKRYQAKNLYKIIMSNSIMDIKDLYTTEGSSRGIQLHEVV